MMLDLLTVLGVVRDKLDAPLGILFFPADNIEYLETLPLGPLGPFARTLAVETGPGAGMGGLLDKVDVCRDIGGIPRSHQSFRSGSIRYAVEERFTTLAEFLLTSAGTTGHIDPSVVYSATKNIIFHLCKYFCNSGPAFRHTIKPFVIKVACAAGDLPGAPSRNCRYAARIARQCGYALKSKPEIYFTPVTSRAALDYPCALRSIPLLANSRKAGDPAGIRIGYEQPISPLGGHDFPMSVGKDQPLAVFRELAVPRDRQHFGIVGDRRVSFQWVG